MIEPWQVLFERAVEILDSADAEISWTMGGGTVLMLRHNHRSSKDIDIFFSDPQPLGYVNPALGGVAERMTSEYEVSAGHIKLYFPEGEVDFVAAPLLTAPGAVEGTVLGRAVRLETDVEIVAKKLWHRGHEGKARDLFDLGLLIETSPDELREASPYLLRNRDAFLRRISERHEIVKAQFEAIDARNFRPSFADCFGSASSFLKALEAPSPPGSKRRQ
jgi:hypothetical protein